MYAYGYIYKLKSLDSFTYRVILSNLLFIKGEGGDIRMWIFRDLFSPRTIRRLFHQ